MKKPFKILLYQMSFTSAPVMNGECIVSLAEELSDL